MPTSRRQFIASTVSASAALSISARSQQAPANLGPIIPGSELFPPVKLRGFGTLAAIMRNMPELSATVTTITCDTPAKALLVQAKYLSDLERLPGVSKWMHRNGDRSIPVRRTPGKGVIVCVARGVEVTIVATNTSYDKIPPALLEINPLNHAFLAEFEPRATVPMFLDRWDKHGLLCYYNPDATPPNTPYLDQKFDFADGLTFCRDHHIGIVLWSFPASDDYAEAITNEQSWNWVQEAARKMAIPVHINTQINPPQLWLANRFPEQTMLKSPQFMGGYYGVGHDSTGLSAISWLSESAEDALLGVFQQTVKKYANDPNIVGWLEPHGETYELPQKFFLDSGPYANERFREFVKSKYRTLNSVSQAWHGIANHYLNWQQIAMPEAAEFAGFGKQSLDLRGTWKVKYVPATDGHSYTRDEARGLPSPPPTAKVPVEWYSADFDDSYWNELIAPGNDRMLFIPRSPLVYRRTVEIPMSFFRANMPVNLYVWDLANRDRDVTLLYVNGKPIVEIASRTNDQHWSRFDITAAVKGGKNTIALQMPRAIICYRVYISTDPPVVYPELGKYRNAQWADLVEFGITTRGAQIRRGAEMIRQVDPNSSINFMAANDYSDVVKQSCIDYGGRFHDTGSMAGFWTDENSLIMSGARLPVSAEAGNGAPNEREFKLFWGRWLTEAVNGVHYFQSWGEIAGNPEVLKVCEKYRTMYEAIGKYHAPFAKVGVLFSLQNQWLTGFPWQSSKAGAGGYYSMWNAAMHLINWCSREGVGECDFASETALLKYKVIIDTNSAFIDTETMRGIEKYVRAGGVFITYGHTGRSTPTEPDSWPISKLTGFTVTGPVSNGGSCTLTAASDQKIYAELAQISSSGLRLKPSISGCIPLVNWKGANTDSASSDVAIGMRKIGQGAIIHFGPEISGDGFVKLIAPLLVHFGADDRVPVMAPQQRGLHLRHFISNSGLHDVWLLFNETDSPITTNLIFLPGLSPTSAVDIVTGAGVVFTRDTAGDVIPDITLDKWETRMLISPRKSTSTSTAEWLRLQRGWWRGTSTPPQKRLPSAKEQQRNTVDLTEGWASKTPPNASDDDAAALLTSPEVSDAAWERRSLGMWLYPGDKSLKRLVLRRKFSIPAHWNNGQIGLCADVPYAQFFHQTRMYLDGKPLMEGRKSNDGPYFDTLGGDLKAGSTHLLALDVSTKSTLIGSRGPIFIAYIPDPLESISLHGKWLAWSDALQRSGDVVLPGKVKAMYLSRTIKIDSRHKSKQVYVYLEAVGDRNALIVNGHLINHGDQPRQHVFQYNISALVQFGEDNNIEIAGNSATEERSISKVEIRIY